MLLYGEQVGDRVISWLYSHGDENDVGKPGFAGAIVGMISGQCLASFGECSSPWVLPSSNHGTP